MYLHKYTIKLLAFSFASTLLFVGCGEGNLSATPNNASQDSQKNLRISTYINKGNFIDVASLAYKKVTDPTFSQKAVSVSLPGTKLTPSSAYNIRLIKPHDKLKKIVVQNHLNKLEIKLMDDNSVDVLFIGTNFTIDRKMTLADFIAAN